MVFPKTTIFCIISLEHSFLFLNHLFLIFKSKLKGMLITYKLPNMTVSDNFCDIFITVDSEILRKFYFSRVALKDILVM